MKITITNAALAKAKIQTKPYDIRDTKTTGFLVRVHPSGKKSYYCEYKRGGRMKIGEADAWSVKQARERAKEIIVEFQKNGSVDIFKTVKREKLTYLQFLQNHYFDWVDINHKSALKTRRRLLNDCSIFHSVHLDSITPQIVEKWRTGRVAKGNSPHTANRCFAYLRASLSKAVEWGFLDDHPLRRMKLIRTASNVVVRFLSEDEELRLRNALESREKEKRKNNPSLLSNMYSDHLMPMVLLSMNTGIRRGELLSLRWANISFDQRRLKITAKTAKSKKERYVPINEEAFRLLVQWKAQQVISSDFVFSNSKGYQFVTIKTGWAALLKRAEINDFRWHDMRHHFASKLAIAGVDLNTIRALLGHASYSTTLRYAHLSEDHKAAAVGLLG